MIKGMIVGVALVFRLSIVGWERERLGPGECDSNNSLQLGMYSLFNSYCIEPGWKVLIVHWLAFCICPASCTGPSVVQTSGGCD